jgi:hypothetical protein
MHMHRPDGLRPTSRLLYERRAFFHQLGTGLGSVALSWLLAQDRASAESINPLAPHAGHIPARAKRCIFLMMEGGPSQIDTFDPKPTLDRIHGTKLERKEKLKSNQNRGNRYLVRSPFEFRRYGECGMDVSELFAHTAGCVDDIAFVRSVYCDSDNHPAALFHLTTGSLMQGSPSMGAWAVYGLGTENQDLPAFVVLRDGRPFGGTASWGNGYLPACFQGTQLRSGKHPILDLQPPPGVSAAQQRLNLDLIGELNREYSARLPGHPDLEARIAAYELAFRMQTEVPDAVSFGDEKESTKKLYGLDKDTTRAFGERCLLARRLVERGVRFVQVWSGGWDSHTDVRNGHRASAARVDRPIAGLLRDLKSRGLLDDTLVIWGGEFGRTPDTNVADKKRAGRDHNPGAMTMWFAGGGVRGGTIVGATDDVGNKAVESRYHLRDVHATFLHLLGLDDSKLVYYHGGRFKQLTDTGGTVLREIIA